MRTLSRRPDSGHRLAGEVEFARLQFTDEEALKRDLTGAATLFNTYWVRFPRGDVTWGTVLENTRTLLRAARAAGVERAVQFSVSNASETSPYGYFRAKALAESALRESELAHAIVRPTLIFGRGELLLNTETAERARRLGAVPQGTLRADPDALRIAVDVLLENAVKYTEPGDSIELRARAEEDGLVIEVADSGPGIPLDAAESIFARSSRTPTREDRPGLGLGLAIVDAIAMAHGGACSLEPSQRGSTFAIRLPGYRSAGQPAASVPTAPPAASTQGSS